MLRDPVEMPVTIPIELMVPLDGNDEDHTPPTPVEKSIVVRPSHTLVLPDIVPATGSGSTKKVATEDIPATV
jgi:hypothetical protein